MAQAGGLTRAARRLKDGEETFLDHHIEHQARQHEEENRQDLDERGEERTDARVVLILGTEHALDDRLIRLTVIFLEQAELRVKSGNE